MELLTVWHTGNQVGPFRHMLTVLDVEKSLNGRRKSVMSYYNHLGFNAPDYYDDGKDEQMVISFRKCAPEISAYLKSQYGRSLPDAVEFWEKLPTRADGRYWIDALSQQAIDSEPEVGDPVVGQYHITDKDWVEIVRQLGKLIDAKKQEISERSNGRLAGTHRGLRDVAYITGLIDGLRSAVKLIQGDNEITAGESVNDIYRRTCERIYSLPWTSNEESTMISIPKDTYREWLRELNEVVDNAKKVNEADVWSSF